MPAKKPQTPKTRDQIVAYETSSDAGKERMISELARVVADLRTRLGKLEQRVTELEAA